MTMLFVLVFVSVLSVGARWTEVYEGPYTGGSVMGTVHQGTAGREH